MRFRRYRDRTGSSPKNLSFGTGLLIEGRLVRAAPLLLYIYGVAAPGCCLVTARISAAQPAGSSGGTNDQLSVEAPAPALMRTRLPSRRTCTYLRVRGVSS